MVPVPKRCIQATRPEELKEWSFLDGAVLHPSRSHKVCLGCHWFRHHEGLNCISLLASQLHKGLLVQGDRLTRSSQGWTDDLVLQKGWAPEGI